MSTSVPGIEVRASIDALRTVRTLTTFPFAGQLVVIAAPGAGRLLSAFFCDQSTRVACISQNGA